MAASKPVEPQSGTGLPRWQVALMVGAPILIGAGAVYLWNYSRKKAKKGKRNGERKTPEGGASPVSKQEKPDGDPEAMNPLDRAQAAKNKGNKYFKAAKYEQAIQCYSEAISRCPTEQKGDLSTFYQNRAAAFEQQNPLDRAQAAKNKGNKYFKAAKYEQAIQCYSEAISRCPTEQKGDLSTFYQNRAAAFEQQQKWQEVVDDCTRAVELNPRYVKALFRRAKAQERLDNKKQCLEDVTAVCILEAFQNQQSMLLADKVLKLLGKEKAKEKYKNREPLMPSPQFIKSYFSSFTDDIISQPLLKGEKADEDKDKDGETAEVKESSGYLKAKQFMEEENYDKIISECTKEIETRGKYAAEALLLRATFYLLIGNVTAAKPDLDQVINMQEASVKQLRANALIKRGSMYMQQQQPMLSTQDFNMAADIDSQNADVYHHRGQLKILLDQVEEAVGDFDKCIVLRPDSALAQAQKCFALALTDQQHFGKANEMYNKCIDLEPDNATTYVHKGLLQLQWKQDLDKGLDLISKAIEIDNKCDFAYETMGTIEVQRGNLDKAIDMFNKAINLAKSEMEMAHLYSLCDAAYAQTEVAKKYGLKPPTL
ncbi:UNVERIFIED_CONTAM: hypothetical protein FKN15_027572 [Acipenser sinensis]